MHTPVSAGGMCEQRMVGMTCRLHAYRVSDGISGDLTDTVDRFTSKLILKTVPRAMGTLAVIHMTHSPYNKLVSMGA